MNRSSDSLSEFLGYRLALGCRGVLQGRRLLKLVELAPKFDHVPAVLPARGSELRPDSPGLSPAPERGGVNPDLAGGGTGPD